MTLTILWVVIAIGMLVLELMTTALVSIWFVPSALLTALLSLFVKNLTVQIVVFLVLSGVFLWLFRKLYRGHKEDHAEEVSADTRLIGRLATVTEPVSVTGGKVLVGDVYWRAEADTPLEEGTTVEICEIRGTTLVVRRTEREPNQN